MLTDEENGSTVLLRESELNEWRDQRERIEIAIENARKELARINRLIKAAEIVTN